MSRERLWLCARPYCTTMYPVPMSFCSAMDLWIRIVLPPQWISFPLTSPYFQGQGAGSLRAHLVSSGWSFQWLVTGPTSSPLIRAFCLNCWRGTQKALQYVSMQQKSALHLQFEKLQTPKHWIGAQEAWECLSVPTVLQKGNISSANSGRRQGRCI